MRSARFHDFASPQALAADLTAAVARRLAGAVAQRGRATLAVSGGTTPGPVFDLLARQAIDWPRVTVTLVDERYVDPRHERSNERLVRERLLVGAAASARFVGLWAPASSVEAAACAAADRIGAISLPLDVAMLGMGNDGHTASFFSDAPNFTRLTDPAEPAPVLPVLTRAGGEPRLTLTLPPIAQARCVVLHIEGAAKLGVLDRVLAGAPLGELPIGAIFDHAAHPVEVFRAPIQEAKP